MKATLWHEAREQAEDLIQVKQPLQIFGSDIDSQAISLAQFHSQRAGLSDDIKWKVLPVSKIQPMGEFGYLIANPPYAERIGDREEVEKLYQEMGKVFTDKLGNTWSQFILTSHLRFEKWFGKPADKKRKLYNGRIECHLYQYFRTVPIPKEQVKL